MSPVVSIAGDWCVEVEHAGKKVRLDVERPSAYSVKDERCGALPMFDPKKGGWIKGYRLAGVVTQETTSKGMLYPDSLELRAGDGRLLVRGKDYEADLDWGTIGRTEGGLGEGYEVLANYRYGASRIDSIYATAEGTPALARGIPHLATPLAPAVEGGKALCNILVSGRLERLSDDNVFVITEDSYPETTEPVVLLAASTLKKTFARLMNGKTLKILAWGDSVTCADFLPNPAKDQWQAQFASRLAKKYPQAAIELKTEAWGGHNTMSYFAEPPGAAHNFMEKVVAVMPDLVISEFVNDGGYSRKQVDEIYGRIQEEFTAVGAEWIIITPHYVLPEWMGLHSQKNIDEDPRKYVTAVREFAAQHGIPVAEASKRWGRLWRQGIPYMTLMMNAINHPDPRGMRIFADSLMDLF